MSDIITFSTQQATACRNLESKSICRRCLQPEVVKNSKESRSRKWWYLLLGIISKFATKAVVFVVGNFSNDVLKSDFSLSLSLSLDTHPPSSEAISALQRRLLFQHDAERRSYRSIPSDKNYRNYKKIHNSIYCNSHDTQRIGSSCAVSFFSFRSSYDFRHDVSKNLVVHLRTHTHIHDREEHTPTFDSFPSSRSIDQFKRRYFRVFHSAQVLGSLIVQLTRRGREC